MSESLSPQRLSIRSYAAVTGGYWAFTITDGALRMLVLLYFHQLGYSPFEIALLFLFYEFFGVVTNLFGGWLGSRFGLNLTMHAGMALQIFALVALTVPDSWLSVPYVMAAQALSGIAKDLNKMSAKASTKLITPDGSDARLFKLVAILTGSKNSLKGAGFFLGGVLLTSMGFRGALYIMAAGLLMALLATFLLLPRNLGKSATRAKFNQIFSRTRRINWLSAVRFFLFGSRDVWFVVGLPVFLTSQLQWSHPRVGGFLAIWIIAYGIVQALSPGFLRHVRGGNGPDASTSQAWVFALSVLPALIALGLGTSLNAEITIVGGLLVFGAFFAVNSSIHSFLILAYSENDKVAMNVGFYYMANAGGRLAGTVLSGWLYQQGGLTSCLWVSTIFLLVSGILSSKLR